VSSLGQSAVSVPIVNELRVEVRGTRLVAIKRLTQAKVKARLKPQSEHTAEEVRRVAVVWGDIAVAVALHDAMVGQRMGIVGHSSVHSRGFATFLSGHWLRRHVRLRIDTYDCRTITDLHERVVLDVRPTQSLDQPYHTLAPCSSWLTFVGESLPPGYIYSFTSPFLYMQLHTKTKQDQHQNGSPNTPREPAAYKQAGALLDPEQVQRRSLISPHQSLPTTQPQLPTVS
jgi:hypothetical protein